MAIRGLYALTPMLIRLAICVGLFAGSVSAESVVNVIACPPFQVEESAPDWWGKALATLAANGFAGKDGVRVLSPERLSELTLERGPAKDAFKAFGADAVLRGRVLTEGKKTLLKLRRSDEKGPSSFLVGSDPGEVLLALQEWIDRWESEEKLSVRGMALADARKRMFGQMFQVFVTPDNPLAKSIGRNRRCRSRLRLLIRTLSPGPARMYSDGTCEVDLALPVSRLAEWLDWLRTKGYEKISSVAALKDMPELNRRKVLRVTGLAAETEQKGKVLPPLWQSMTSQQKQLARKTALADAKKQLLRRIGSARLTPELTVGAFLEKPSEILDLAPIVSERYDPDLICRVRLELPVLVLIDALKRLSFTAKKGIRAERFEALAGRYGSSVIRVTGAGEPGELTFPSARPPVGPDAPEWASETMQAKGLGWPPKDVTKVSQRRYLAAKAARLDAVARLKQRVLRLSVIRGKEKTTVGELLAKRQALVENLQTFLGSAYETDRRENKEQKVTLTLELPLRRAWLIVLEALKPAE